MIGVMKYMYESCLKKGIPIGVAPNIEVSLIVQPDDGRYLAERNVGFFVNQWLLKAKRFLAHQMVFKRELQPRRILASETDPTRYKTNWKDTTQYSPLASYRITGERQDQTGQTLYS